MSARALLITSPAAAKNKYWTCSITSHVGSLMPPCDLATTAAMLRKNGVECRIFDMRFSPDPFDDLDRQIRDFQPDAAIMNLATASAPEDLPVLDYLRDRVEKRIVFGFHAMALPQEAFDHGVTHVLMGDPEYGAPAAVLGHEIDAGVATPDHPDAPEGRVADLDDIPFATLDLLDLDHYKSILMGQGRFSILMPSRGCSYRCPYCTIPFLLGGKVRWHSPKRVVDEIERDYREFGVRSFFCVDAAINLKPKWTREFCEELIRRDLPVRWCSNMRVPPVTRELLDLMKRSGCFRIFYGVEDLDLVDELDRRTTRDATREAFRLTREAGLESVAFLILFPGVDDSERAMARRMVNMARDIGATAIQVNVAIPYPGSAMFDEYRREHGMTYEWEKFDAAGNEYPYESKVDLIRARRMIYFGFYARHPIYFLKTVLSAGPTALWSFLRNAATVVRGKTQSRTR